MVAVMITDFSRFSWLPHRSRTPCCCIPGQLGIGHRHGYASIVLVLVTCSALGRGVRRLRMRMEACCEVVEHITLAQLWPSGGPAASCWGASAYSLIGSSAQGWWK